VSSIYEKLNNPYLVGIDVDWGRLEVSEVFPARIPDLFAGQPLVLVGRFDHADRGRINITGTVAGRPWRQTLTVEFPSKDETSDVIATLWARRKIHELSRLMYSSSGYEQYDQEVVDMITDVALDYQIMSEYTSFVAVCEEIRTVDGRPVTVEVPVNMPQGVSYDGVFGGDEGAVYAAGGLGRGAGGGYAAMPATSGAYRMSAQSAVGTVACEEMCDYDASYYTYVPTPHVAMTSAAPYLGLLPSQVRSAFRDLTDEIQGAYEEFAERNTADDDTFPTGTIVFAVEVSASGAVTDVSVVSDGLSSAAFARTIAALLGTAVLPVPPDGAGTVSVTFEFSGI
jgi:hypothetical protein